MYYMARGEILQVAQMEDEKRKRVQFEQTVLDKDNEEEKEQHAVMHPDELCMPVLAAANTSGLQ